MYIAYTLKRYALRRANYYRARAFKRYSTASTVYNFNSYFKYYNLLSPYPRLYPLTNNRVQGGRHRATSCNIYNIIITLDQVNRIVEMKMEN